MFKITGIFQLKYIPWKGYFNHINMVEKFILYDDMQYTRRDWRNRNKGTKWFLPMFYDVLRKLYEIINSNNSI